MKDIKAFMREFAMRAGADLDPIQVLSALSADMPLANGVDILSHLLCERLHRHRQGSIIRSLHKACHLSASVDRAEVMVSASVSTLRAQIAFCSSKYVSMHLTNVIVLKSFLLHKAIAQDTHDKKSYHLTSIPMLRILCKT